MDKSPVGARGRLWWRNIDLALLLILLASAFLRLADLDYSHFQGDEVKALYPPDAAFPDFLFDQKKGPIQFLVTLLVRLVTGGYEEWVTRLPFALASLLAVYVVYRLVANSVGRFPALVSAALLGTCGLVTAFGRVVQYQPFGILFVLVTASFMLRWLRNSNPLHLYLGFVFYALALLTHYDALALAPTLGIIVITGFRRHTGASHSHTRHLLVAGATGSLLAGLFYIPYMLQPNFPAVKDYLLGRIASGSGMQTFASTYALLGLYLPPLYLTVTIPLLVWGVVRVLRRPRAITGLIFLFWFVSVFAFYMLLGGDPRSHVYNYFLPGLVLVALGLEGVVESAGNLLFKRALQTAIWVLIIGSGSITYYMLVDHSVEHPWYAKKVLGYTLPHLEARNIDGVFGFPYQRGLHTVGLLFQSGQLRGTFDSNERDAMADYYFRARRASPPDYYVYVHRPLSLRRDLPAFLTPDYWVIAEISVGGTKTIDIYESRLRNLGGQGATDSSEPASCGRPDPRGGKEALVLVHQGGLPDRPALGAVARCGSAHAVSETGKKVHNAQGRTSCVSTHSGKSRDNSDRCDIGSRFAKSFTAPDAMKNRGRGGEGTQGNTSPQRAESMSGDEREEFELIDEVSGIRGLGRRKIGDEV